MAAKKIEAIYADVGALIRVARESMGMSQAMLGEQLKPPMTRASVANMENGKQRIMLHSLIQIARTLDMTLDVLTTAVPVVAKKKRSIAQKPDRHAERLNEKFTEQVAAV